MHDAKLLTARDFHQAVEAGNLTSHLVMKDSSDNSKQAAGMSRVDGEIESGGICPSHASQEYMPKGEVTGVVCPPPCNCPHKNASFDRECCFQIRKGVNKNATSSLLHFA